MRPGQLAQITRRTFKIPCAALTFAWCLTNDRSTATRSSPRQLAGTGRRRNGEWKDISHHPHPMPTAPTANPSAAQQALPAATKPPNANDDPTSDEGAGEAGSATGRKGAREDAQSADAGRRPGDRPATRTIRRP